jgi:MSHA biogenesis protein MshO
MPGRHQSGFTLIEVITTLVITSILAVGISSFLGRTVGGYVDTADRQRMASALVVASEKISRDLRHALPNSVRIGGGGADNCIEFVPVIRGGYYSSIPVDAAAGSFDALSMGNTSILSGQIAVYPVNQAAIYSPSDSIASAITAATASIPVGANQITVSLGASHQFAEESPGARFFLVDQPFAFCQPVGSDRIYRYRNYGFNAAAILPPTGGIRELLIDEADNSNRLSFDYNNATLNRNAVISFGLAARADNESLVLNQEVQVRNVP